MIKTIEDNNIVYSKIFRANNTSDDDLFYTRKDDEIQVGTIKYKKDYKTGAHYHNHLESKTNQTDEIFLVQEGSARVDFYNDKGVYIKSSEIFKGDVIILYKGAHNMVFYEDTKLFVIKPGVYETQEDTTRIIGANNLELVIEND